MKKQKVYVVTAGEYSDYHIEKVFSSKRLANLYSMLDSDRHVETYDVDDVDVDTGKMYVQRSERKETVLEGQIKMDLEGGENI